MSEYGTKWENLKTWLYHLRRKQADSSMNPDRDNYKEGYSDAIETCIRWMEADDMTVEK